jgi:hypothetical protein
MFVCLRNIAMSASWYADLNFTRYAPFELGGSFPEFSIGMSEYEMYGQCRTAGTRGGFIPEIEPKTFLRDHSLGFEWAQRIRTALQK